MRTSTCADRVAQVIVIAIKNMDLAAAHHGSTRVDGIPVVVGIGDKKVTGVFRTVAVAMADKRSFEVVVEVDVAHSGIIYCVGDI